ncbi:putative ATPase [Flavobacterium gossypii]|uniref:ATPase n=1 Tax=Flavobacterium gossypii TaxID=1646119 RepID=A0ABR6DRG7_9FLAO|nr:AAA family ATPase [Flavobacterium gossypii]MBA9074283.1 putative ATPase [Flavobacterium gossypii]
MTTYLKLRKFKKITEEIVLTDFAPINYIVGENGSGKTSILNALSFLNDGSNSRHFFGPHSIVEFSVDEKSAQLKWNKENPNKTENHSTLLINIYILLSNLEQEKGANNLKGKAKIDSLIGIGDSAGLSKLNEFFIETGNHPLVAKKYVDQDDPFNQDNGRLIFESEVGEVNPIFIADGLRAKHNFTKNIKDWVEAINETHSTNIFIIEEPENNLHPNFQKEIPSILESILKKINPEIVEKIFFFISTHSPFIISACAKYPNQKVYPIQNGMPLFIDSKHQSWNITNESSGYNGSDCAYIVSKMLGAEITDIGYPENFGVLEEYSLQLILDNARDKGIIKNIQFVSASGISKAVDLSTTIYELEKLNTLVKCNPYYFDKYFMVVDNISNIKDDKLKERISKIEKRLNERFIQLMLDSLENYYQNIDKEISEKALHELSESDNKSKGEIKFRYAKQISDIIVSREDFSKLFNSELDFLLV